MVKIRNPLAFARGPVTVVVTIIYLAAFVSLIVVHTRVPAAPKSSTQVSGIDLNEAWRDLQILSREHHPYNSHANDWVHDWLLLRINEIIRSNQNNGKHKDSAPTIIFDDDVSNLTFSSPGTGLRAAGITVYFEGKNIITWIQGEEDDVSTEWWAQLDGSPSSRDALLVNAHYDSVSSGYGATDDGVGVICILQLLKYYTAPGHRPKHGIVLLLNDGEEDFLNGAYLFGLHPMAKLVSSFLNLEGAGAGGRATLFRSTDAEITKAYANSPHPFGSVISADGFEKGLVRSQTDYVVFNAVLGLRGLDVAFFEPRDRYHTKQDDSRHTNRNSLWHMLSAALATSQQLTSKPLQTNLDPDNNPGSSAIWFDMFGRGFAVLKTHSLFALSVTLLVAGPVVLVVLLLLLYSADKFYLFSGSQSIHTASGDEPVPLNGWRGFFRFPLVLLCACAAPVALAYLLFKENEFICHSSEWAVWATFLSAFVFVAWFLCRVAEFARPSSLTRAYGLTWMYCAWWLLLLIATILEENSHVGGVYWVLIYAASTLLATSLAYLELFSLPKKSKFCTEIMDRDSDTEDETPTDDTSGTSQGRPPDENAEAEPTEQTGLLGRGSSVFKKYGSASAGEHAARQGGTAGSSEQEDRAEQEWSKGQWDWLWMLQFLVLVPVNLILVGQIALLMVSALHQTGADGSNLFLVYLAMAIFSILLLAPLVPFIHRLTWQVPVFLLLVLIGTLIYNLIAFPFSSNNRLKLSFQQELDLDEGSHRAHLTGAPPFVRNAVLTLPSAKLSKLIDCEGGDNRQKCSYSSWPPEVAETDSEAPPSIRYKHWLQFNASRARMESDTVEARFVIRGENTRACKIVLEAPFTNARVHGQGSRDKRIPAVSPEGSKELRLWARTWNNTWTVDMRFEGQGAINSRIKGKAICLWSDVNQRGVIPAYDEALHYAPEWVAITKAGDGLLEGFKNFEF